MICLFINNFRYLLGLHRVDGCTGFGFLINQQVHVIVLQSRQQTDAHRGVDETQRLGVVTQIWTVTSSWKYEMNHWEELICHPCSHLGPQVYFHIRSPLDCVKIIPHQLWKRRAVYPAYSISWLLMIWWHKGPRHQPLCLWNRVSQNIIIWHPGPWMILNMYAKSTSMTCLYLAGDTKVGRTH